MRQPLCQSIRQLRLAFVGLLFSLQATGYIPVWAQTVTVRGQVDANHLSLPNVRIRASQSGQEVVSDKDGKFTITLINPDTLLLTHLDYPPRQYVLPVLDDNGHVYFDMATNKGFWVNRAEDKRGTLEPSAPAPGPPTSIPAFPWPVPAPSAKAVLDTRYFATVKTLAQADALLRSALQRSGYPGSSYYQVPHGFAMVAHIEQIDPDGTPKEGARWSIQVEPFSRFSLSNYFKLLFMTATGHFRVIVFLVTDVPAEKSRTSVTRDAATAWYEGGVDFLPASIARQPFTPDYRVTALIYEFEKPENSKVRLLNPGTCLAEDHLSKAKITTNLHSTR